MALTRRQMDETWKELCAVPDFWETLEELKSAGATSVLVLPVEKMLA